MWDSEGRVRDYWVGYVIVVVGNVELLAATAGGGRAISDTVNAGAFRFTNPDAYVDLHGPARDLRS